MSTGFQNSGMLKTTMPSHDHNTNAFRSSAQRVADKLAETEKDKPVGQIFSTTYSKGDMLDALADVYLGFTFWSVLTGLGLLIWYFPLWHMGISGYEAFVMAPISPFLLGITSIRRTVVHNVRLVHFLSLSGLVAFLIPKPEYRLFAVGFSIFMSSLAWSATWWSERAQPARLESRISAFSLGLLTSSVAKYACQTNNPIWPAVHAENGGWNYTGLVLAIVAILRVTRKPLDPRNDVPGYRAVSGSSFPAALGFAGLMFGMHSLLSDSSTMISWVWEGFPIRGPIAVPHGNYTFLAMGLGLLIGLYYPAFARTWTFYGIGALGAAFLTAFSHWSGFYGGLALATYLMAAAPVLIGNAARYPPGRTFFAGFLFYNILVLAHVWTVAYAFVPGGPLMREHTDWVMTAMMLFIGCGIFSATASETKRSKPAPANPYARKQRSHYIYILIGLQLLGASISYLRFPTYDYTPYHAPEKSVTAGIWTTHFGLDNPMWTSERRIGALVKEMELDVLGLLESDTQRIIMGNRDSTQYLAEELGMYVDYGPGPNKHTWGCALLSKFPIVNSTHHLLPSPVGELAPAIHATLDAYGEMIDVFVFHSGQEEDPEDRRLQSEYLADLMGSTPRPAILLSYLVTKTGQGNYNTYVSERSGMRDIDPSDDWDRWCEYILYKGLRRSGYARVSRGTITDTELQVSYLFVLPALLNGPLTSMTRLVNSSLVNPRVAMTRSQRTRYLRAFASQPCSVARASEVTDTMSLTSPDTMLELCFMTISIISVKPRHCSVLESLLVPFVTSFYSFSIRASHANVQHSVGRHRHTQLPRPSYPRCPGARYQQVSCRGNLALQGSSLSLDTNRFSIDSCLDESASCHKSYGHGHEYRDVQVS